MRKIIIKDEVGEFAENKEIAKTLREEIIIPALAQNQSINFDFDGVSGATQSFIHALVSEPIRRYGDIAFDNLFYEHANDSIKKIIEIVYRYMQESMDGE